MNVIKHENGGDFFSLGLNRTYWNKSNKSVFNKFLFLFLTKAVSSIWKWHDLITIDLQYEKPFKIIHTKKKKHIYYWCALSLDFKIDETSNSHRQTNRLGKRWNNPKFEIRLSRRRTRKFPAVGRWRRWRGSRPKRRSSKSPPWRGCTSVGSCNMFGRRFCFKWKRSLIKVCIHAC